MRGERVLVTGGAGFIGSNLAEALAEEKDVVILDDLSTGKLDNIKNLQKKNNVRFIKGSITDDRLTALADTSRARTFGYDPESGFKEELKETIRWFSNGNN